MEKSGRGGNWHYGLMRAFSRECFRQGVSIFTLICFVPFSLQPWNFAAWADSPASPAPGLIPLSLAMVPETAATIIPQPSSSADPSFNDGIPDKGVDITNPEYWVRVARVLPSGGERVHEDLDTLLAKAYTVRSPKAKTESEHSKPDLRRYRPDAKSAPQPAVENTALPAAAETGTAMEKASVSEARTVLERGDTLLQENRPREAMRAYFEVVDGWPESPESDALDNVVNALAWDAEAQAVDPLELLAFVDGLPRYAECRSEKAKYWVVAASQIAGENLSVAGQKSEAKAYLERGRDDALRAMREMPDSPYQIFFPVHYVRCCRLLGGGELDAAVAMLKSLISGQQRTTMLKYAARLALTISLHRDFNDITESALQCGNLLDEYPGSDPARMLEEKTAAPNVQAHVAFTLGYARFQMSHFGTARKLFESVVAEHSGNARLVDASLYMCAYLKELAHSHDPSVGIAAYSEYMKKSPGGEYYPVAMLRLAAIYNRIGELSAAVELMRKTLEYFPNLPWADSILTDAADKEAAIRAGMENKLRADRLRGDFNEGLCGPFALALLLEDSGKSADVRELAREADSNASGASLAGLLAAAAGRGLSLSATRITDYSELRAPAVAHLSPDHFVLVRSVNAREVVVEDPSGQRKFSPEAFMGVFSGFLLTPRTLPADAPWLTQETLESVRGACDEFFSDMTEWYLQCINQQCIPVCKTDNSPGSSLSAGDAGAQTFNVPGAPKSLTQPTLQPQFAFSRPGVSLGTTTNHRGLTLGETDLSVKSLGGMSLDFTRTYANPWGSHKASTSDESRPFKNNLGSGWGHNWNTHLRVSSGNGFVYHVDGDCQDTRHYTKTDSVDGDGNELYTRTPRGMDDEDTNALTEERAMILRRHPTQEWIEILYPNGMVYHFGQPINTQEKYSRLEWVRDRSGNTVTLTYSDYTIPAGDPPVNTNFGRLSRVDAPSGDGRYLAFTYAGNRISRVELRKNATPSGLIKHMDYGYGPYHTLQPGESNPYPNFFLRSAQADGKTQDRVSYEYDDGEYNGTPHGLFPWKITDKKGNQLNIVFEYAIQSSETFISTSKITLTHPDGLVTEFQKGGLQNTAVRNYDGATVLSRVDYLLDPHGVMLVWAIFYPGPVGNGTPIVWAYGYSDLYNFSSNNMSGAGYTYNDKGRLLSAAQGGVYYRYVYPTEPNIPYLRTLYPVERYGPGTINEWDKGPLTVYDYDNLGRLVNVKPPDMGSNGITYQYDNYGQVNQITNPLGQYESFAYDNRGNQYSHTDYNGHTTTFTHDDLGRILTVTAPGNQTTTYTYSGGCPSCGGASGQIATITTPDNKVTSFTYDANGNRLTATDPMNRTTTTAHDSMDRPTSVILPGGRTMSYAYDKLGRVESVTGTDGKLTKHRYDYRGLPLRTWLENDPGTTADDDILVRNDYDEVGRLTTVTDAMDRFISYTYTGRGAVWQTIHGILNPFDPDTAKILLTNDYDTYGRLKKTGARRLNPYNLYVDPVEYFYNNTTGQLTKKRFTNGAQVKEVEYAYDDLGRPDEVDDWIGGAGNNIHHFIYDNNGQVTDYTDFDGSTLSMVYDPRGQVTSMSAYESGNTHSYGYTNGRLTSITAPGNRHWGNFIYNDAGQPASYTWPNGMTTHYTYDTAGRLTGLEHKDGAAVKAGWSYELANDDNIVRAADARAGNGQAWEYEYDTRGRLIHALRFNDGGLPLFRQAFAYDAADNLSSVTKFNLSQVVRDTFADGEYTSNPAWTVWSGTWSAASYYLAPVPADGQRAISTPSTTRSPDLRVDYYVPPTLNHLFDNCSVYVRYLNTTNHLRVVWVLGGLAVIETVNGVETYLATYPNVSLTPDSWQTLYVQLRNEKLSVYHAPQGRAPRLLGGEIPVSSTMNTTQFRLAVGGQSGFRFDNVAVHSRSLDAEGSTVHTYNPANQLVTSTTNGVVTNHTYDPWGRLSTRTRGAYSASYEWRYGDKLASVTSNFPGEAASVAYDYDGLGQRRNRSTGTGFTWWRWSPLGDNMLEYNDPNTNNEIEGFSKFSIMLAGFYPLAEAIVPTGQPMANATYSYLALDRATSTRAVFNQAKTQTSTMEFYPHGERLTATGTLPDHQLATKKYDADTKLYFDNSVMNSVIYNPQINKTLNAVGQQKNYSPVDPSLPILADFMSHYFGGSGRPFNLNQRGYIDDLRAEPQIKALESNWKAEVRRRILEIIRERCKNNKDFIFGSFFFHNRAFYSFISFPDNWYPLGNGFLHEQAVGGYFADCCHRKYMYTANLSYKIRDMFDDPLKVIGIYGDPLPIYMILGEWYDVVTAQGSF